MLRDENTDADDTCDDGRVYYLTDALGNVTALVDSTGTVLERYVYDPYGQVTIYDDDWSDTRTASSYDNTRLYTGRELDPTTGLYYYRARWYDTLTGNFTTRDPAGFAAGDANLYRYVGNRPVGSTDPSGLWEMPDGDPSGDAPGYGEWGPAPEPPGFWEDLWNTQVAESKIYYHSLAHPIVSAQAFGQGYMDGSLIVSNDMTFHQVDDWDTAVDNMMEEHEGTETGAVLGFASGASKLGVGSMYTALGVGLWGALGGGQFAIGVGPGGGTLGTHFTYGFGRYGTYQWAHGTGGLLGFTTTVGAKPGVWRNLTGIPIASPGAVAAWVGTKPDVADCFVSMLAGFGRGWGFGINR